MNKLRSLSSGMITLILLSGCLHLRSDPPAARKVNIDRTILEACAPLSTLPARPVTVKEVLDAVASDQLIHEKCMQKHKNAVKALRDAVDIIEQ